MPIERFRALAEAYGGVIARWPEAERTSAASGASEPAYAAALAQAIALDAALDQWTVPGPSPALAAGIIAAAPPPPLRWGRKAKLWWSGMGLAAILAGAAAGSMAVAAVTPSGFVHSTDDTAFGAVLSEPGERL